MHAVPSLAFVLEQVPAAVQVAVWQTPGEHLVQATPPLPQAAALVAVTQVLPFQQPVQQLPP